MAKSVKKSGAAPKAGSEIAQTRRKQPRREKDRCLNKRQRQHNGNGSSVPHDQVAQLAHRFWNERGRAHGHHEEDWYRAEQALRSTSLLNRSLSTADK